MTRAEELCPIQNLFLKLFEVKINHGRDVERDELGNHQAADNYEPERAPRGTIRSVTQRDRHRAKHGGQGRHEDRAEPIHAGVVNRFVGRLAGVNPLASEVNNHDPVLFTIPISMNMPTNAYSDASCPNRTSVNKPPTRAVGSVDSTVKGCT